MTSLDKQARNTTTTKSLPTLSAEKVKELVIFEQRPSFHQRFIETIDFVDDFLLMVWRAIVKATIDGFAAYAAGHLLLLLDDHEEPCERPVSGRDDPPDGGHTPRVVYSAAGGPDGDRKRGDKHNSRERRRHIRSRLSLIVSNHAGRKLATSPDAASSAKPYREFRLLGRTR
jgi:hypothetical protein